MEDRARICSAARAWLVASLCLAPACLSSDTGIESAGDESSSSEGTAAADATDAQSGSGSSTSTSATQSGPTTSTTDTSTTSTTTSTTGEPQQCDTTPLRVATFNIREIGFVQSDEFAGLAATISRIGADVVCMEEVLWNESAELEQLAEMTGYDNIIEANGSPAIGGDPKNACMSRLPFGLFGSFSGEDISPDSTANDVGRDILAVRVQAAPGCYAGVIAVHLKSGFAYQDQFRRQVEAERLGQVIAAYREERPDDALIVMGDFNEPIDAPELGLSLDELPADLPDSYRLGNDIVLPLVYDPFAVVTRLGLTIVDATWEDSDRQETWNSSSRLDYIAYDGLAFDAAEVYNACEDDGVDNDPPGNWLPKQGDPLSCFASESASDHLPVFADFTL